MRVKVWGARGSLPSPLTPEALENRIQTAIQGFLASGYSKPEDIKNYFSNLPNEKLGGFGGNTPCIEVTTPEQQLIIDGGSGMRLLGYDMLKGPCGQGKGEVHVLFTHFHWDHLLGLPFFTPIFIPGNKVHVYSVQPELKEIFKTVFKKPYFPLNLEQLGAKIEYHTLEPRKPIAFKNIAVTPYQLDHPDPCWGYKIESGGKSYSHCVDTECTRVSRDQLGPDLPLYQNIDLMIFDAQYTLMESIEKVHWGHAAASLGLDIAMREGVKKILFMHHDPAANDEKIAAAKNQARLYYKAQQKTAKRTPGEPLHEVEWDYIVEGMSIEL